MEKNSIDTILVYGDEYRKENLRYVCNFWPIFERAVCVIPRCGEAILAGAPEGENYAREMSVLKNYCNVKEFACVSVPEEIALYNGWITEEQLLKHADDYGKSPYGDYLRTIAKGHVQNPINKQSKREKK
jgi:hypothetical protein